MGYWRVVPWYVVILTTIFDMSVMFYPRLRVYKCEPNNLIEGLIEYFLSLPHPLCMLLSLNRNTSLHLQDLPCSSPVQALHR